MTRNLKVFAAASTIMLAGAGATAGTLDQRVEINSTVSAPALAAAPGQYKLSNGKILSLQRSSNGVFAQIDNGITRELLLVDPNRLRSKDGRMEVAVVIDANGEVHDVTMRLGRA